MHVLCKWRANFVRKRSPLHRLWSVVKEGKSPTIACPDNISCYLPSRRRWIRLGPSKRNLVGEDHLIETTIYTTALRDLSRTDFVDEPPAWIAAFRELCSRIDTLRSSDEITFKAPTLHLVPKATGNERRCLASFENVADRILLSRSALYLRDVFDPYFSDDCFAFRRDGAFNYRTAIDDLVRYRMKNAGRKLYVAECDIQSFFDVINHDVVLEAYDRFVERVPAEDRPPDVLRNILVAYLQSFTSRGNLMASEDPKIVEFRHLVKPLEKTGVFGFYNKSECKTVKLGIPQGGALSPLLANLVLDAADRAVREDGDPGLLYIRFCDDVIFVHPRKSKCRAALIRYMQALAQMKLPCHPVKERVAFDANYYERKSKGPFAWCGLDAKIKNAIPWVSFLGVHIRYDGFVRVRKDSMKKHEKRLRMEVKRVKDAVGPDGINLKDNSLIAKETLLRAFEARIVAMGTGYATMREQRFGKRCWMSAFPALTPDGPAMGQMRHLDSVRGHQVSALKRQLGLKPEGAQPGRKGYFGRPYSYYGMLLDVERHKSFPKDPTAYSKW